MTRTWIEPIYNRTYGDVEAVQLNPYQQNPKGCWNAVDLNRIEKNTAYCAEWMLEKKVIRVPAEIIVEENDYWSGNMIPTKTDIDRIINNVRILIEYSSNNPAIAPKLPTIYPATQINYVLANQIEYALDLMHNQPALPLTYWTLKLTHGIVKMVVRADGTVEQPMTSEVLVAEDERVTILGQPYGQNSQFQLFTHWSGAAEDIGLLANYQAQETTFDMPYRNVELTADFETHIPRTLTINSGYISVNNDPTAETGPSTNTYFAGDRVMIIANVAPAGKAFYDWTGTQEGLDNITGITDEEDPSTCILVMPDCDVTLTPHYINAGQHYVSVTNGSGSGWYDYGEYVSIYASVPNRYEFANWSGNTSYLSDIYSNAQSFKMGDINLSFTAHFNYVYSYNSVQVIDGLINVNNNNVSYATNLRQGTSYTLVPTPPDNSYGLYNWTIEGVGSVSGNTFTVGDGNAIVTAHYAPKRTLSVTNVNNLNTTSTYTIVQGYSQTISTTSLVGSYRFDGWYEDGVQIGTSTSISITMGATDRTIEARYSFVESYTITTINVNNDNQTTTTQVLAGTHWNVATNEEVGDYLFVRWLKDGNQVSTSNTYGFDVSGNTTLSCEYRPKETYHLTVVNGTGSGDYKERQAITITADAGNFSNWTGSNLYYIASSTSSTTTVKLGRADGTVTAHYNMRTITIVTNTGTNTYSVRQGNSISINAGTPPTGKEFNHWEITSGDATLANAYASSTYAYAQTQDSTITAVYTNVPQFMVSMENGYIWDGSNWVTNATLYRGSTNAIKMKPAPTGYQFLQWEVYVNNVLQTDANDVSQPLAEQTTLRNLTRAITVRATYFIPDPTVTYTLSIIRKDGAVDQNSYPVGTDVAVYASVPDQGYQFYKWTGATAYVVGGVYNANSLVHMPAQNITITETYVPEGYIPGYDLEMTGLYGQCCYTTETEDPNTHEIITTDNWVSRWTYPEGTVVRIRATGYTDDRYFSNWTALNHSTSEDARSIIANLNTSETTLTMPNYDVDVTPVVPLKDTYQLTVTNGATSGTYYEGAKADVYFNKNSLDTNDVHYVFTRWVGGTGTDITTIELWDGGMFNVLTPGNSTTPQFIKMPNKATELIANYKTLYRITINNGTIDTTGTPTEAYYETGTTLTINANPATTGMRFQYWSGDTSHVANIYNPTTTVVTTTGATNLTAIYSTDTNRNGVGYVSTDLKSTNSINNSTITIISGTVDVGFMITDINGHIYVVTAIDSINDTSTIYRMTKIVQGGNIYG